MVIERPPKIATPEVAAQFDRATDIIVAQTDTLFIDSDAFLDQIIVAAQKEYPAISLYLLVDLAVARLLSMINARAALRAVYFGCDIKGGPATSSPPSFSKDVQTCGFDGFVDGDDDFIIGKTLYGSTLRTREAARDPATRPVFYSRFFPRLLSKLQSSTIIPTSRGAVEVTVMHPLFRRYSRGPPGVSGQTTLTDILHPNHIILNGVPAERGGDPFVTDGFQIAEMGSQFILIFEGCMRRAVTSGRASRVEVHTARDSPRGEFALLATLLQYAVLGAHGEARPFDNVGVTFHYPETILSVLDVYTFLARENGYAQVINALAWWIAINGTDYWPGMAPAINPKDRELLLSLLSTDVSLSGFAGVDAGGGDVHVHPYIFEKAVQDSFLKRTEYQRVGTDSSFPVGSTLIQNAIDVYYGALLPDAILPLAAPLLPETARFKSYASLVRYLKEAGVSEKVLRIHPFAGDAHPVQIRRRAAMVAWTLAFLLHGHRRGFSNAQSPNLTGSGVIWVPPATAAATDQYYPYIPSPARERAGATKTYTLATDPHLGALLRDVGFVVPVPPERRGGGPAHRERVRRVRVYTHHHGAHRAARSG